MSQTLRQHHGNKGALENNSGGAASNVPRHISAIPDSPCCSPDSNEDNEQCSGQIAVNGRERAPIRKLFMSPSPLGASTAHTLAEPRNRNGGNETATSAANREGVTSSSIPATSAQPGGPLLTQSPSVPTSPAPPELTSCVVRPPVATAATTTAIKTPQRKRAAPAVNAEAEEQGNHRLEDVPTNAKTPFCSSSVSRNSTLRGGSAFGGSRRRLRSSASHSLPGSGNVVVGDYCPPDHPIDRGSGVACGENDSEVEERRTQQLKPPPRPPQQHQQQPLVSGSSSSIRSSRRRSSFQSSSNNRVRRRRRKSSDASMESPHSESAPPADEAANSSSEVQQHGSSSGGCAWKNENVCSSHNGGAGTSPAPPLGGSDADQGAPNGTSAISESSSTSAQLAAGTAEAELAADAELRTAQPAREMSGEAGELALLFAAVTASEEERGERLMADYGDPPAAAEGAADETAAETADGEEEDAGDGGDGGGDEVNEEEDEEEEDEEERREAGSVLPSLLPLLCDFGGGDGSMLGGISRWVLGGASGDHWGHVIEVLKGTDKRLQIAELTSLYEFLSYTPEDGLRGFPTGKLVDAILDLLGATDDAATPNEVQDSSAAIADLGDESATAEDDAGGGDAAMAAAVAAGCDLEEFASSQIMAANCLYMILDVSPPSASHVVRSERRLTALAQKLKSVEFIDLAEKLLQIFEKLSEEQPAQLLRSAALTPMLAVIDFFPLPVQWKAVKTARNLLAKVPTACLFKSKVLPVLPTLAQLLKSQDPFILQTVGRCWRLVVDQAVRFAPRGEELEQQQQALLQHQIDRQSRRNDEPTAGATAAAVGGDVASTVDVTMTTSSVAREDEQTGGNVANGGAESEDVGASGGGRSSEACAAGLHHPAAPPPDGDDRVLSLLEKKGAAEQWSREGVRANIERLAVSGVVEGMAERLRVMLQENEDEVSTGSEGLDSTFLSDSLYVLAVMANCSNRITSKLLVDLDFVTVLDEMVNELRLPSVHTMLGVRVISLVLSLLPAVTYNLPGWRKLQLSLPNAPPTCLSAIVPRPKVLLVQRKRAALFAKQWKHFVSLAQTVLPSILTVASASFSSEFRFQTLHLFCSFSATLSFCATGDLSSVALPTLPSPQILMASESLAQSSLASEEDGPPLSDLEDDQENHSDVPKIDPREVEELLLSALQPDKLSLFIANILRSQPPASAALACFTIVHEIMNVNLEGFGAIFARHGVFHAVAHLVDQICSPKRSLHTAAPLSDCADRPMLTDERKLQEQALPWRSNSILEYCGLTATTPLFHFIVSSRQNGASDDAKVLDLATDMVTILRECAGQLLLDASASAVAKKPAGCKSLSDLADSLRREMGEGDSGIKEKDNDARRLSAPEGAAAVSSQGIVPANNDKEMNEGDQSVEGVSSAAGTETSLEALRKLVMTSDGVSPSEFASSDFVDVLNEFLFGGTVEGASCGRHCGGSGLSGKPCCHTHTEMKKRILQEIAEEEMRIRTEKATAADGSRSDAELLEGDHEMQGGRLASLARYLLPEIQDAPSNPKEAAHGAVAEKRLRAFLEALTTKNRRPPSSKPRKKGIIEWKNFDVEPLLRLAHLCVAAIDSTGAFKPNLLTNPSAGQHHHHHHPYGNHDSSLASPPHLRPPVVSHYHHLLQARRQRAILYAPKEAGPCILPDGQLPPYEDSKAFAIVPSGSRNGTAMKTGLTDVNPVNVFASLVREVNLSMTPHKGFVPFDDIRKNRNLPSPPRGSLAPSAAAEGVSETLGQQVILEKVSRGRDMQQTDSSASSSSSSSAAVSPPQGLASGGRGLQPFASNSSNANAGAGDIRVMGRGGGQEGVGRGLAELFGGMMGEPTSEREEMIRRATLNALEVAAAVQGGDDSETFSRVQAILRKMAAASRGVDEPNSASAPSGGSGVSASSSKGHGVLGDIQAEGTEDGVAASGEAGSAGKEEQEPESVRGESGRKGVELLKSLRSARRRVRTLALQELTASSDIRTSATKGEIGVRRQYLDPLHMETKRTLKEISRISSRLERAAASADEERGGASVGAADCDAGGDDHINVSLDEDAQMLDSGVTSIGGGDSGDQQPRAIVDVAGDGGDGEVSANEAVARAEDASAIGAESRTAASGEVEEVERGPTAEVSQREAGGSRAARSLRRQLGEPAVAAELVQFYVEGIPIPAAMPFVEALCRYRNCVLADRSNVMAYIQQQQQQMARQRGGRGFGFGNGVQMVYARQQATRALLAEERSQTNILSFHLRRSRLRLLKEQLDSSRKVAAAAVAVELSTSHQADAAVANTSNNGSGRSDACRKVEEIDVGIDMKKQRAAAGLIAIPLLVAAGSSSSSGASGGGNCGQERLGGFSVAKGVRRRPGRRRRLEKGTVKSVAIGGSDAGMGFEKNGDEDDDEEDDDEEDDEDEEDDQVVESTLVVGGGESNSMKSSDRWSLSESSETRTADESECSVLAGSGEDQKDPEEEEEEEEEGDEQSQADEDEDEEAEDQWQTEGEMEEAPSPGAEVMELTGDTQGEDEDEDEEGEAASGVDDDDEDQNDHGDEDDDDDDDQEDDEEDGEQMNGHLPDDGVEDEGGRGAHSGASEEVSSPATETPIGVSDSDDKPAAEQEVPPPSLLVCSESLSKFVVTHDEALVICEATGQAQRPPDDASSSAAAQQQQQQPGSCSGRGGSYRKHRRRPQNEETETEAADHQQHQPPTQPPSGSSEQPPPTQGPPEVPRPTPASSPSLPAVTSVAGGELQVAVAADQFPPLSGVPAPAVQLPPRLVNEDDRAMAVMNSNIQHQSPPALLPPASAEPTRSASQPGGALPTSSVASSFSGQQPVGSALVAGAGRTSPLAGGGLFSQFGAQAPSSLSGMLPFGAANNPAEVTPFSFDHDTAGVRGLLSAFRNQTPAAGGNESSQPSILGSDGNTFGFGFGSNAPTGLNSWNSYLGGAFRSGRGGGYGGVFGESPSGRGGGFGRGGRGMGRGGFGGTAATIERDSGGGGSRGGGPNRGNRGSGLRKVAGEGGRRARLQGGASGHQEGRTLYKPIAYRPLWGLTHPLTFEAVDVETHLRNHKMGASPARGRSPVKDKSSHLLNGDSQSSTVPTTNHASTATDDTQRQQTEEASNNHCGDGDATAAVVRSDRRQPPTGSLGVPRRRHCRSPQGAMHTLALRSASSVSDALLRGDLSTRIALHKALRHRSSVVSTIASARFSPLALQVHITSHLRMSAATFATSSFSATTPTTFGTTSSPDDAPMESPPSETCAAESPSTSAASVPPADCLLLNNETRDNSDMKASVGRQDASSVSLMPAREGPSADTPIGAEHAHIAGVLSDTIRRMKFLRGHPSAWIRSNPLMQAALGDTYSLCDTVSPPTINDVARMLADIPLDASPPPRAASSAGSSDAVDEGTQKSLTRPLVAVDTDAHMADAGQQDSVSRGCVEAQGVEAAVPSSLMAASSVIHGIEKSVKYLVARTHPQGIVHNFPASLDSCIVAAVDNELRHRLGPWEGQRGEEDTFANCGGKATARLVQLLIFLCELIERIKRVATTEAMMSAVRGATGNVDDEEAEAASVAAGEVVMSLSDTRVKSYVCSPALSGCLLRQLCEPLSVASFRLPRWMSLLAMACPPIFSFDARKQLQISTTFGMVRAMLNFRQKLKECAEGVGQGAAFGAPSSPSGGRAGGSLASRVALRRCADEAARPGISQLMLSVLPAFASDNGRRVLQDLNQNLNLPRTKVKLPRDQSVLSAIMVMEHFQHLIGKNNNLCPNLEIEFVEEEGVGSGLTLEFYSDVLEKLDSETWPILFRSERPGGFLFPHPYHPAPAAITLAHVSRLSPSPLTAAAGSSSQQQQNQHQHRHPHSSMSPTPVSPTPVALSASEEPPASQAASSNGLVGGDFPPPPGELTNSVNQFLQSPQKQRDTANRDDTTVPSSAATEPSVAAASGAEGAKAKKGRKPIISVPLTDETPPAARSFLATKCLFSAFKLLGQLAAKALMDGKLIDLRLHPVFWRIVKNFGQQEVLAQESDLLAVDPGLYRSLSCMREMAVRGRALEEAGLPVPPEFDVGNLALDFTVLGTESVAELVPNGSDISVTNHNVEDYIRRVTQFVLWDGVKLQIWAFSFGFASFLPLSGLAMFDDSELSDRLISGGAAREDKHWKLDQLRTSITPDHGYTKSSPPFMNLLEVMSEFTTAQRRQFLKFCSGAPVLPPEGFAGLRPAMRVVRKHADDNPDQILPSVMTCTNYVKLPAYNSKEALREKLLFAIKEGQGAFTLS